MKWLPNTPIEDLGLTMRTYNCLRNEGLLTVADVLAKTEAQLKCVPNMGGKSVREVLEVIHGGAPHSQISDVSALREEIALWRGRYEGALAVIKQLNKLLAASVEENSD